MAENSAIIVTADVTGRLSTQAYTRLFAKNGGSTVDATFLALCIAEANSRIRTMTRSAFPAGLYSTTDTLDPEVVGRGVDLVCMIAASRHLSNDETSGYHTNGKAAEAFFKALNRDADARAPGSTQGPPLPQAAVHNLTNASNVETNPYTRAADHQDSTGF